MNDFYYGCRSFGDFNIYSLIFLVLQISVCLLHIYVHNLLFFDFLADTPLIFVKVNNIRLFIMNLSISNLVSK